MAEQEDYSIVDMTGSNTPPAGTVSHQQQHQAVYMTSAHGCRPSDAHKRRFCLRVKQHFLGQLNALEHLLSIRIRILVRMVLEGQDLERLQGNMLSDAGMMGNSVQCKLSCARA